VKSRRRAHILTAAVIVLAATSGTGWLLRLPLVLHDGPSDINGRVVVTEEAGERTLRFSADGPRQSVIRVGKPLELVLPYTRTAMTALALVPQPKRVLIIGLGGGAMAMALRSLFPDAEIDGVDIDPAVVAVAQETLGLKLDAKLRAIVADGRAFTESSAGQYDLIFLDAYSDAEPPKHLMTAEFLAAARKKLSPGGVAVANVWSSADNKYYPDVVRTWNHAFGALCVVDVVMATNVIFLARGDGKAVVDLPSRAAAFQKTRELGFDLADEAKSGCVPQAPGGKVLRDAEFK
jgi:spermidine synthase